jgi:putative SOS response-associated peptidase YedK
MCGRAAQSISIVQAAAELFHVVDINNIIPNNTTPPSSTIATTQTNHHHHQQQQQLQYTSNTTTTIANTNVKIGNEFDTDNIDDDEVERTVYISRDNYNMSPGMDAIVFWMNHSTNQIQMKRMVWGLLPRNGSINIPLEKGMNKHFNSLMFNARSDTLYDKPTFYNLSKNKQSCIIAMDGFYEWKTEMGRKQPYFVYRNKNEGGREKDSYLLMAGLWKSVTTGWNDQPILDTFTIITTEVCEPLKWLHSRMPVTIWDTNLAMKWIQQPSTIIHSQLVRDAQQTKMNQFQWHPVTTAMSSMKFRSMDAMKAIPKQKTVKSFFTKATTKAISKDSETQSDNVPVASTEGHTDSFIVSETPPSTSKTNVISTSMESNSDISVSFDAITETTTEQKKRKAFHAGTPTVKKQNKKLSSPSPRIDSFFIPKSMTKN